MGFKARKETWFIRERKAVAGGQWGVCPDDEWAPMPKWRQEKWNARADRAE